MAPSMFARILPLLLISRALSAPLPAAVNGTKYLFVFGDSYTSTGFSITGAKPSAANPLGNPSLNKLNTMSGGLTWPGFLATQFNTSLTYAYVFAVAGATVDNSIVPAYSSSVPSISDQVKTWTTNLQSRPSYAPWTAEDALAAVWIGVNDVGNSYSQSGEEARLNKDLDRYFALLGTLYTGGIRNFALLNIPPTQKTPQMKGQSNVASLVSAITLWNSQLLTRVTAFLTSSPEANITLVDTQEPWNTVIADPKSYGAPDATCVNANGKSCLWYNSYHPGQAIHKVVAQAVASALKGSFF
ncbi:hypothetical protein CONLIGDRAFT_687074 [Coniochaeta ligniaria NRRL 30616]|uniref:Carbohydrate esterase family 16 protein n=1 Tax=Coniochaeta ligniaria NRRL 30616 TaxID=1408157 RepID=A0A1J7I6C6_9PEZI|nr:hypothetical protein CONLIGDRAFT_687074 [Coniochaeta ligniaria NRRL 30616]